MKKRYILEGIVILIALGFPFYNSLHTVDMNLLQQVITDTYHAENYKEQNKKAIRRVYDLTDKDYEEAISYGPSSYMSVNEITVFKQSNHEKRQKILQKVKQHIEKKISIFKDYGTNQVQMLENALIEERGEFIICIVGSDSDVKNKIRQCF